MTRSMTDTAQASAPLSVVIPALNSAADLPATLRALEEGKAAGLLREAVIADGGSDDATATVVASLGARVVTAPRGRGPQLIAGAAATTGEWLLFLHADSRLPPGWSEHAAAFMAEPANRERAAAFRLALDDPDPRARRIERLAGWRARRLGLPYGDQGLLIARAFYEQLGGFRPLVLMEDVDLVRRIGKQRLVLLEGRVTTSAERYRRGGWLGRPLRNLTILAGYYLGVPTSLLRRYYE